MENAVEAITLPRTEDLAFWLFWLGLVIFLLSWDLGKAWKRGAPWIPGQALGLSAIIIQLLSFIDYSHIRVYSGSRYETKKVVATLVKDQLVIDSGRLMMCVLIAYLLPGMARSDSIMVGGNLAALALGIASHAFSELQSFWSEGSDRIIFDVWSAMLIPAIMYLLVLLIKAVMSGGTICRIGSQKIRSVLSDCCTQCDRQTYNGIKDHVLKCWIAVRFSQPDYVLVRTGVCSTAFPFVTVCIVVHVIQWIYVHFTDNESLNRGTRSTLVQFVIAGHYVIVAIGWIVLLVRWVHYYTQGDTSRRSYLYSMIIEDAEIDLSAFFGRLSVRAQRTWEKFRSINSFLRNFSMENSLDWLTSLKQRLLDIITTVIEKVKPREVAVDEQHTQTVNRILLPEENASFLLGANERGFRKVERYMDQRQEHGKSSPPQLIRLLSSQTVSREGEVGTSAKEAKDLLQANGKSWKRTAVSLIHLMIEFYNGHQDDSDIIENAMQCYIRALEYMNFVDGLDEEVKSLGRQADKEFKSLQHFWHNRKKEPTRTTEDIRLHIRMDTADVANECLSKTRDYCSASKSNKVDLLQSKLANVYSVNMTEDLNNAVLQKCSKLAEECMEEEILAVAILAAKAQGVLDKVREGHNTDQTSTISTIPIVIEQVGEGNGQADKGLIRRPNRLFTGEVGKGNNTAQASTSSHIPTGTKKVGPRRRAQIRSHPRDEIELDAGEDDSTDDSIPLLRENRLVGAGDGVAQVVPLFDADTRDPLYRLLEIVNRFEDPLVIRRLVEICKRLEDPVVIRQLAQIVSRLEDPVVIRRLAQIVSRLEEDPVVIRRLAQRVSRCEEDPVLIRQLGEIVSSLVLQTIHVINLLKRDTSNDPILRRRKRHSQADEDNDSWDSDKEKEE